MCGKAVQLMGGYGIEGIRRRATSALTPGDGDRGGTIDIQKVNIASARSMGQAQQRVRTIERQRHGGVRAGNSGASASRLRINERDRLR
jgi:hypothetical protein